MGLELDTVNFEIRLPTCLVALRNEVKNLVMQKSATLKQLQSLIGMLNFACQVVPPGCNFLWRLINLTIGLKKPFHHRRLNSEARADLKAWQIFLDHFNGKAIFPTGIIHSSSSLHLFNDASNLGFCWFFLRKWFFGRFSRHWLQFYIAVRELLPIVIS